MIALDWMRLKSGTDIRGLAVADGEIPAVLTEKVGAQIGAAFAQWVLSRTDAEAPSIAVGCDSRVTGEALKATLVRGLSSKAVHVLDCGLCTTPAMFMTTLMAGCAAAVMVTASHMPWRQNGYKFFTAEGGLSDAQIREVLKLAEHARTSEPRGDIRSTPFLATYTDFLKKIASEALGDDAPLAGLHVIVDAGNGAGGFYAELLTSLGAKIDGSQFLDPDGRFPNHIPNPESPEAMQSLSDAVLRARADLGVIFDADCDRAALVDADGRAVNRNRLIAMVSAVLLRESPGATIVTDSVTSAGLERFLAARGGVLRRFKRGYQNVIGEARKLNAEGVDCPLAMETSGHAALRENHFLDDGMYLMTRMIIEAQRLRRQGQSLSSLIEELLEPVESAEVRLPIRNTVFRPIGEDVLARVKNAAVSVPGWMVDPKGCEGVRVTCGTSDQWFLLRLSVHDPLLVLNAESDRVGGVREMLASLHPILAKVIDLDLSALEARLSNGR